MYAVWFGSDKLTDRQISQALFELWEETWKQWNLPSTGFELDAAIPEDERFFEPFLKVGHGFYLLFTESHWSPGDICGFILNNELIGSADEVVAVRLDSEYYIPHQGLMDDDAQQKFRKWQAQAQRLYLVSRS